ncbi:MAG: hypothetical protein Q4B68_03835 [Bacteroidales bacterium]|nr:hypothetical protein [Bacteroidales bacterium]
MTKRTYFIIISLLVALDIATGFWYIAGHINSDGNSDIFDSDHDEVTLADTISSQSTPDRYEMVENNAYFVSTMPAIAGNMRTYFASIKRIKSKVPTEINGRTDVETLMAAVAEKAFPNSHGSLQAGIQMFLKTPSFNVKNLAYKVLDTAPTITAKYGNVQGVRIYPIFTSRSYLVMAIAITSYNGTNTSEKQYFVNYNRSTHTVLHRHDILAEGTDEKVLELVNQKIGVLVDEASMPLHSASRLSPEIYLRSKGIFFVYQPGEVADATEGVIEIFVPFKSLQEHLTPSFRGLVVENADYCELKPLAFNPE